MLLQANFEDQTANMRLMFACTKLLCVSATVAGKFSREDLAAAWLQYVVLDLIQLLQYICVVNGTKRAFFCGGLTAHPQVRYVITRELARRNMFISLFQQV